MHHTMQNNTMHHRTAGTVKAAPPVTVLERDTSASKSATARRKKQHAHRAGRHYSYPPSDMAIAIGSTVVLTVITVLTVLKVYSVVSEHHSNAQQQPQTHMSDDWIDSEILPFNPIYTVPGSVETVGDRSDAYVQLRQRTDPRLPADSRRSLEYVRAHVQAPSVFAQLSAVPQDFHHSDQLVPQYDIYHCPDTPPAHYPFQWPILDLLNNWPADTVDPPASNQLHQGLCVFDYARDYDKAVTYRNAELPFVVVNDPAVAATVERWSQPDYLRELLREEPHRTEFSENNHFMYYVPVADDKKKKGKRKRKRNPRRPGITRPEGWTEPTKLLRMPYSQWLAKANVTEDRLGPDQPHWYYRLIGCGAMGNDGSCDQASSEYLFDELPFFQPRDDQLYIVEPEEQKGCVPIIECVLFVCVCLLFCCVYGMFLLCISGTIID